MRKFYPHLFTGKFSFSRTKNFKGGGMKDLQNLIN